MILAPSLVDATLERLGLAERPANDARGLARLYDAFATEVPFDNLRKRIHLASGDEAPLPGDDPATFLSDWLRDGAGGTCWAIAGALHALLEALGFRAERVLSTMLVGSGDLPPNHGTVVVEQDGAQWLVDPVLKSTAPLRLDPRRPTAVPHPARGVGASPRGGTWIVRWWPLHVPDALDCRIDRIGASAEEFRALHQGTRGWSPFNFELYVRVARGDCVDGIWLGQRGRLDARGERSARPLGEEERPTVLAEMGFHDSIARLVPPDLPTPPPPGSRTAARRAGVQERDP